MSQSRRTWRTREIELLEAIAPHGAEAVAMAVGRSTTAVRKEASRRGVSLRRHDPETGWEERRGRRQRERAEPVDLGGPMCPHCGFDVVAPGGDVCQTCKHLALAAAHERQVREIRARRADAERRLVAARQRAHRERELERKGGQSADGA